jgi:hypothetical protein
LKASARFNSTQTLAWHWRGIGVALELALAWHWSCHWRGIGAVIGVALHKKNGTSRVRNPLTAILVLCTHDSGTIFLQSENVEESEPNRRPISLFVFFNT